MKILIYSKSNCPQCVQATSILEGLGTKYIDKHKRFYLEKTYVDAGKTEMDEMKKRFEDMGKPEPRSVPQIFIDLNDTGSYEHVEFKDLRAKVVELVKSLNQEGE
jgi:glutaredoxin|nr:MAG TPA: hypothetical protein [Bacteriophage sp.]DAY34781.1 MAG TPA: hypothetical protein [Bacteriophage sp.]